MTMNISNVIEAINVEVEIEGSFSGSLATSKLIAHFSAVSAPSECMDNFTSYCHAQKGWKRKCDIGKGKSKVACGWQALQAWSCMILLNELSLWSEELTVADRNELVKKHWLQFGNVVAKRCFRNSVVFNNMASMRSKPTKNVSGKSELPDVAEDVEVKSEDVEVKSEVSITLFDTLQALNTRLASLDTGKTKVEIVAEVAEISADIAALIDSLK